MTIDSGPSPKHRAPRRAGGSAKAVTDNDIRKRSPLEQAIAEKTDRNARYEASKRRKGFRKTSVWVREEHDRDLRALLALLNDPEAAGRDVLVKLLQQSA